LTHYHTLADIRKALLSGQTTCHQLVRDYLACIQARPEINAFLEVYADEALAAAEVADADIAAGRLKKLTGMVIGIKDNIAYKNHRFSASSKILAGFESLYSSTVVERLLAEGAIIIGRLNCDEFAMGSSNENSAYGSVLNPLDTSRVPGGSSGGSAAAVAAGFCHASLGTDTGGSIRQPAAYCGLVGLKPTYGRVSRHGIIAFGSSFDQVGPLTHSVADSALLLEVMAGADDYDATCVEAPVPQYLPLAEGKKYRFGLIEEIISGEGIDPELKAAFDARLAELEAQGHELVKLSFPYLPYTIPTYYILATAEASSNLSRYTGVLYGKRSDAVTDLESAYKKSRTEGFGPEVKRRIMMGTFVLSEGYYDAYYGRGQRVRRLLRDKTNELLNQCDALLLPTTTGAAFRFGEKTDDPIQMYLEDIYTVLANLTGMPAISVPFANNTAGLPFGIQLIGKNFDEKNLLDMAHLFETNKN
jgi:aspartyl-tRNA(Asn)/glutamyl-tRNA(Gln) amidotransferase subunit A